MRHMNPWQLDRFDDGVFETMTRDEYHRYRSGMRRMVTPGLEGLAALADPTPTPVAPAPATNTRGRRTSPAPAKQRGRRT